MNYRTIAEDLDLRELVSIPGREWRRAADDVRFRVPFNEHSNPDSASREAVGYRGIIEGVKHLEHAIVYSIAYSILNYLDSR